VRGGGEGLEVHFRVISYDRPFSVHCKSVMYLVHRLVLSLKRITISRESAIKDKKMKNGSPLGFYLWAKPSNVKMAKLGSR